MRSFGQLVYISFKLTLREPITVFFTLAFPVILVVVFGAIYGNEPAALFGGYGSMDISMPAYTALILGSTGLLTVPINISQNRESGVLRRFRATPLQPATFILADVVTNLIMTLAGMVGLVIVGWLLFRVRFEGQPVSVLLAVILGGLSMFSIGYLIASVVPGARAAQVVGMAILYPMMFLSGAGIPLEVMPEAIRRIADFLPLAYVVRLLRGVWFGEAWGQHLLETAVLGGVLVGCTLLAARFFRWE